MSDIAAQSVLPTPAEGTSFAFTRNQRWTLVGVSLVAYFTTSALFHAVPIFRTPGFGGSLLLESNPIISLTMIAVWLMVIFVGGTWAGRTVRPDVGLFAAAVAAFAIRRTGGVTRDLYLQKPVSSTLMMLAVELAVIAVLFGVMQLIVTRLIADRRVRDDAGLDGIRPTAEPLGQKLLATLTHALVAGVILLLTIRSDERMQVTGMLIVASLAASACTVRFIPATPSCFFWLGPIVAGIVGYVVTALTGTGNLNIGEPAGYCAALARALPLDYASAGIAASIYGYWVGRTWIPEDVLEPVKA